MPRPAPANAAGIFGSSSGFAPVVLLDVQLIDGTILYLCDYEGIYPVRIGGPANVAYKPWIKSLDQFHLYKTMRTDAGTVTLQNLSGNSVQREVIQQINASEFEGGLAIVRWWHVGLEWAAWEFHGKISAPQGDETEAKLRLLQLFDPSPIEAPVDSYSEQCFVAYKLGRCGSVSGLPDCAKTFGDCTVRGVPERFAGISNPPPQDVQSPMFASTNNDDGGGPPWRNLMPDLP